jgi:hypothetical protein
MLDLEMARFVEIVAARFFHGKLPNAPQEIVAATMQVVPFLNELPDNELKQQFMRKFLFAVEVHLEKQRQFWKN